MSYRENTKCALSGPEIDKGAQSNTDNCLQIASHPSIYVLDTPGILLPEIADARTESKLALTGFFSSCHMIFFLCSCISAFPVIRQVLHFLYQG